MEDSKTLPKPPDVPVMPPEIRAINDKMRSLYQQLGIHYSNKEKAQKAIDELEIRLDALRDAVTTIQNKEDK